MIKRWLERAPNGITLHLYVQPGASSNGFVGLHGERLKLKIRAQAVDDAANTAVCAYLAQFFAVSKSCVTLQKGNRSREKVLFVAGDPTTLSEKLQVLVSVDQEI